VKTGKWSDGDQWVQETAGASVVSEEVMTRSSLVLGKTMVYKNIAALRLSVGVT